MSINIWGKVSLVLALFGAVGMGFGIATVMRTPATGENVDRSKAEAPSMTPAIQESSLKAEETVVVVPEKRDTRPTQPAKIDLPPNERVETRQTAPVPLHDTDIIGRMLASEKRLGDALFVLRRDYKQLHDTVVMLLNRAGTVTPARAAQTRPERVEKSVVARRALEGYLSR